MMKQFKKSDLGHFIPNEWSDPDPVLDQMLSPETVTGVLWGDDGMVSAISCCRAYWGNNWSGWFLISKNFKPHEAILLREYIKETMEKLNIERLQTDSLNVETLNKWHEFLGFEHEGIRRKALMGKDFVMWSIVREI